MSRSHHDNRKHRRRAYRVGKGLHEHLIREGRRARRRLLARKSQQQYERVIEKYWKDRERLQKIIEESMEG